MRGPRTWKWLVPPVLAALLPWGCYFKLEGDHDPFRCDPACSGGKQCYRGSCVAPEAGVDDGPLSEGGVPDGPSDGGPGEQGPADLPPPVDLTAKAGDPCTNGNCGPGLICMANVCHAICSTECGDKAPECQPDEGCHEVTPFAAACLPGTAKYPESCDTGVSCIGGYLCVNVSGKGTMCLTLCKYGCPAGTTCGTTNDGCEVCVPL